jgi:hypothetical protein
MSHFFRARKRWAKFVRPRLDILRGPEGTLFHSEGSRDQARIAVEITSIAAEVQANPSIR